MIATQLVVCHADSKFLSKLIYEINCKLASSGYKSLQNRKFGFNFKLEDNADYLMLAEYKGIIEDLIKCDDCLNCTYTLEDIISSIKNKINELR